MTTTTKQDNDFVSEVIGRDLLENSIEWIKTNLDMEDVYGEKALLDYASNYDPDAVFF